jgi:hypothetical protein
MKKIITLVIFIIAVTFVVFRLQLGKNEEPILGDSFPEEQEEKGQLLAQKHDMVYGNRTYDIYYFEADPKTITLYPNFSKKAPANKVFDDLDCRALVNGGFYMLRETDSSNENVPIGLFVSSGSKISEFQNNRLHNGILSVNQFGVAQITREPTEALLHAVQAGPILKENGTYLSLNLEGDKPARRVAAAVTGENRLMFIAIVDSTSSFSGPFLADLPGIIKKLEEETGILIADAVNLDGGAASAFYAGNISISEVSPIGSYWCVK